MRIRPGLREIIGKIPTHVIATTSPLERPGALSHVYLVFDDGLYYEFYANVRIGWPHDERTQRQAVASILGKPLERVESYYDLRGFEERESWVGAGLILVARGGDRCQFVAPQSFCATGSLDAGGLLGALSYLGDDLVLLHVRQRRKYVKRLRPARRERRRG
jgi:hypothetical protein